MPPRRVVVISSQALYNSCTRNVSPHLLQSSHFGIEFPANFNLPVNDIYIVPGHRWTSLDLWTSGPLNLWAVGPLDGRTVVASATTSIRSNLSNDSGEPLLSCQVTSGHIWSLRISASVKVSLPCNDCSLAAAENRKKISGISFPRPPKADEHEIPRCSIY